MAVVGVSRLSIDQGYAPYHQSQSQLFSSSSAPISQRPLCVGAVGYRLYGLSRPLFKLADSDVSGGGVPGSCWEMTSVVNVHESS